MAVERARETSLESGVKEGRETNETEEVMTASPLRHLQVMMETQIAPPTITITAMTDQWPQQSPQSVPNHQAHLNQHPSSPRLFPLPAIQLLLRNRQAPLSLHNRPHQVVATMEIITAGVATTREVTTREPLAREVTTQEAMEMWIDPKDRRDVTTA